MGEASSGHRANSRSGVVGGGHVFAAKSCWWFGADYSARRESSVKWTRNCAATWTAPMNEKVRQG